VSADRPFFGVTFVGCGAPVARARRLSGVQS